MEGFFGTCAYMLQNNSIVFAVEVSTAGAALVGSKPFLVGTKALALFFTTVLSRLDLKWKVTNTGFPINYVVFAVKPNA